MLVKIFQVRPEKANLVGLEHFQMNKRGGLIPENYECVYEGPVDAKHMEAVFYEFNFCKDLYPTFLGRALGTSDIVEQVDGNVAYRGCYYCNNSGFTRIDNFDTSNIPYKKK